MYVPTSLMPKGVEHCHGTGSANATIQVPTSLMPKGVEHATLREILSWFWYVPTSLMPKGVEHWIDQATGDLRFTCAHLSDAERR